MAVHACTSTCTCMYIWICTSNHSSLPPPLPTPRIPSSIVVPNQNPKTQPSTSLPPPGASCKPKPRVGNQPTHLTTVRIFHCKLRPLVSLSKRPAPDHPARTTHSLPPPQPRAAETLHSISIRGLATLARECMPLLFANFYTRPFILLLFIEQSSLPTSHQNRKREALAC